MKTKHKFLIIVIFACLTKITSSQSSSLGNNRTAGFFLGWNGGAIGPLEIRNDFAQPINFFTAGAPHMTIRGQAGFNQGFVGINIGNPAFRLDVFNGSTNITGTTANGATGNSIAYYIAGRPALRFPGSTTNLNFHLNVAVGDSAGSNVTSGNSNVFVGKSAGCNLLNFYA